MDQDPEDFIDSVGRQWVRDPDTGVIGLDEKKLPTHRRISIGTLVATLVAWFSERYG